jgi:tetratricopeptide (TPR) repeat protein
MDQDQPDESLGFYQRSLEICQQIGNTYGMTLAYNSLGEAYRRLGRLDEALAHLQQAANLGAERGDQLALSSIYVVMAGVYLAKQQAPQAIEMAGQALGLAREVGNRQFTAEALAVLGRAHVVLGDRVTARQCLRDSAAVYAELGNVQQAQATADELAALSE